MLIKITSRCNEVCPHCMDACTPSGHDMPWSDFVRVLKFLKKIQSRLIHISGGEPTLHPQFEKIVNTTAAEFTDCFVLISTNFPVAAQKIVHDIVRKHSNVGVQISADSRYYKNSDRVSANELIKAMPRTHIVASINADNILPLGRAKGWATKKVYASCTNTYLVAIQKPDMGIGGIVRTLQSHKRYCAPMIDAHGNIRAGESSCCTSLGHFSNPKKHIGHDTEPCKNCGLKTHTDIFSGQCRLL